VLDSTNPKEKSNIQQFERNLLQGKDIKMRFNILPNMTTKDITGKTVVALIASRLRWIVIFKFIACANHVCKDHTRQHLDQQFSGPLHRWHQLWSNLLCFRAYFWASCLENNLCWICIQWRFWSNSRGIWSRLNRYLWYS